MTSTYSLIIHQISIGVNNNTYYKIKRVVFYLPTRIARGGSLHLQFLNGGSRGCGIGACGGEETPFVFRLSENVSSVWWNL